MENDFIEKIIFCPFCYQMFLFLLLPKCTQIKEMIILNAINGISAYGFAKENKRFSSLNMFQVFVPGSRF